jgi:hypothetical protein
MSQKWSKIKFKKVKIEIKFQILNKDYFKEYKDWLKEVNIAKLSNKAMINNHNWIIKIGITYSTDVYRL